MKFDIPRRTGGVLYTAEIECAENAPKSRMFRLAVENAVRAAVRLRGADFAGVNFADADLANGDFVDCNFSGASLACANLAGANLAGANLARANLAYANLADASLARANLRGARGVIDAGVPDGYRVVAYLWDGRLMLRAGCKTFTADEAEAYWTGRPERAECLAALSYIRDVARLRGWQTGEPTTSRAVG